MILSIGTVHNRLEAVAEKASEINQSQDLSGIEVGLQDKIYQADKPVLVGVDAASSYCFCCRVSSAVTKTLEAFIYWM
ncbi:MAG: hypothetical protein WA949_14135 [Phormidesmis sp.]